ncbi:hypothetical protein SZN_19320, partial [Streptomyces zinciresistens K42]
MSREPGAFTGSADLPDGRARQDPQPLWREEIALRNRMLARSAVSAAEGILMERYGLPAPADGFELLRNCSQKHNIKLHTLADAVVRVPGPDHGAPRWFPGRARSGPPGLAGVAPAADADPATASKGAALGAALTRALEVMETDMGNVQLAESGLLRLDRHRGLDRQFTDYFAFVEDGTTACAQAATERAQVLVRDVARAEVFDETSRRVILHAGSRACHSVPVLDERGALLAVISSHHARPLAGLSRSRHTALDTGAAALGRWLSWHRRTLVLDALEELHA